MSADSRRTLLLVAACIAGAVVGCGRAHQGPTISEITDQTTAEDVRKTVAFTVADLDTRLDQLRLSGFSSNPAVVPTNNIVFEGLGAERKVTICPVQHSFGRTTITVRVSDGVSETNRSFRFNVHPFNGPTEELFEALRRRDANP